MEEKVYYTVSKLVDPDRNLYQFLTVVEDEDIAKDLCKWNYNWTYIKHIIEN